MADWNQVAPYSIMLHTELVEPRAYQLNIAQSIYSGSNTLVILPTGLGKTLIAVLAIAKALYEGKRALMFAPTKPLSEQHSETLKKLLNIDENGIALITGSIKAKDRLQAESHAKVIVATPQTIANDLKAGRLSIKDFGIAVFDECHKAIGKYAYTYVADECLLNNLQVIGLTASPGSNAKKISQLIKVLGIEKIEMRISSDADVSPYVMDKTTKVIYLENNAVITSIMQILKSIINEHLTKLYHYGLSPFRSFEGIPKRRLLELGDAISRIEAKNLKFMAMHNYIYVIDLMHAYELVSTEGLYPFVSYFDSLASREQKSRTLQGILSNNAVNDALNIAREAIGKGIEHPKMFMVLKLIKEDFNGKTVIIFAQYRSTLKRLVELMNANGINARVFMGKKEGITLESQQKVIADFRAGKFNVLAATSIGEEGLDIPSVDAVIFYEPVASEVRAIQRRGRAGRIKSGSIVILVAKGTKDAAYLMASSFREMRMKNAVEKAASSLKKKDAKPKGQQSLFA